MESTSLAEEAIVSQLKCTPFLISISGLEYYRSNRLVFSNIKVSSLIQIAFNLKQFSYQFTNRCSITIHAYPKLYLKSSQ